MISRLLAKLLLALFARIYVVHLERSAQPGAFILAANHISHFDPPVLSVVTVRKIDWMAMADLFRSKIFAHWADAIDTFPVDRDRVDRASVKIALKRLRLGHMVGMFPEGGIRDGARSVLEGAPFDPGIAALAQISGAPILPCVILGTDRFYHPKNWLPFRRTPVWIAFGEPITSPPGASKAEARAFVERELGAAFRRLFAELSEHFGLTDDDIPQPPKRRRESA